jgi:hypothetical protein
VSALVCNAFLERDTLSEMAILADLGCSLDRVPAAVSAADPEPARIGDRRCDVLGVRVDAIDRDVPSIRARASWFVTTPTVQQGELRHDTRRYVADLRVGSVGDRWSIVACQPVFVGHR